jgi:hypothetical protein
LGDHIHKSVILAGRRFWNVGPYGIQASVVQKWSNPMTTELRLTEAANRDLAEPLSVAQKEALQRAVAKIVALGEQVGVSADQMIDLLDSGLTVGELLEILAARAGEVA